MKDTKDIRVLVIDDNEANIKAAKNQLSEKYNLTVATSFGAAERMLNHEGHRYLDGPHKFDVVLTDMLMPASDEGVAIRDYPEQPYGLIFVLSALRRGIKMIGLVTDGSHHASPMHWALDMIGYEEEQKVFKLGDAKFYCDWLCLCKDELDGVQVKNWELALDELLKAE